VFRGIELLQARLWAAITSLLLFADSYLELSGSQFHTLLGLKIEYGSCPFASTVRCCQSSWTGASCSTASEE